MKVSKKIWMFAIALVLVAAFVLALRPSPLVVDLEKVARGPLRVTLDEEGETRVRERFVVSAPAAGRVLRIEMEPGVPVRAGVTVLATIRPNTPDLLDPRSRAGQEARMRAAESALGKARADRERVRAEVKFSQADFARTAALGKQGIVSRASVEVAELALERSRAGLTAADFAVQTAAHDLEAARASLLEAGAEPAGGVLEVRSPVDGVVLRRLRESEAVVVAGEALVEVGDPRDLEIVADLLSTDAAQIRPGQPVEIEQWGGGTVLAGRVRRIEPSGFTKISALGVEEQRVNVIIDLADPPARWAGLGDGFRVETRVVLWERQDVLQVPASSLFRDEKGWEVYAVKGGQVERRHVEVGRQNGLRAEIVSGLEAGESVVLHPSTDVRDGIEVQQRADTES
ncbi:MAG TPA: efflux RND transporter periplasmic adaptor subunit [Thermoanaerobaculia bacterium]|nr:efflux RND transporter periplasmic adaptor subunit [Thermoanaerobaculia bacterium]